MPGIAQHRHGLIGGVIGLTLAGAASTAGAQPLAPTAPLEAAAQSKVAAPPAAPAVKAGEGGGPGAAAPKAPARRAVPLSTSNWPKYVPARFPQTGVNKLKMTLTMPGGQQLSFERPSTAPPPPPPGMDIDTMMANTLLQGNLRYGEYLPDFNATHMMLVDGDTLRFYASFGGPNGEIFEAPVVSIPAGGGEATVRLNSGATLTVTVSGAHPLTEPDRARITRGNAEAVVQAQTNPALYGQ